jgi:hypothetical protein
MGKRKKQRKTPEERFAEMHPDWVVTEEIQINGRWVSQGTELSISDERGRFKFLQHVQTPTAEWIDVIGGPTGTRMFRSFRSERVRRVHWKNKLRESVKNQKD